MTDDLSAYGLGALPDAPDERDYPISALYAAEGLTATVTLPAFYAAPGMPPVLNQHATPMCVAYSSSAMKAWQDRRDQERFFDFDEPKFFGQIGGTSAGAYVRDAMERMRRYGYPVVASGDAGSHKIAAYYAVPHDLATIKAAILDLGPIVVSTTWYRSWFHPVERRPASGRRGSRRARHRRLRLGREGAPPSQQLGLRLGRLGRLLDAGVPRAAPGRGVEGRRRHRAPDPVRPHRRCAGASQPERPPNANHGGGEGRHLIGHVGRYRHTDACESFRAAAPRRIQRDGEMIDPRVRGESYKVEVYEDAIGRAFEHVAVSSTLKASTVALARRPDPDGGDDLALARISAGARPGGPAVREGSRPRPPRGDDGAARRRGGGGGGPPVAHPDGRRGAGVPREAAGRCGRRRRMPAATRSPRPCSSGSTSLG